MFEGLFTTNNNKPKGVAATMPTPIEVKGANEHMKAMLQRIWDLEQRVKEQTELLDRREAEYNVRFQNMDRQKELEMVGLHSDITKLKERNRHLEVLLKERDMQIAYLCHRCSYLDTAASFVPLLDQLSHCLKTSLASPPPKVQSVKPSRPTAGTTSSNNSTSNGDYQTPPPDVPTIAPHNTSNAADNQISTKRQQQYAKTTAMTTTQQYLQQYPESVASIYASNQSTSVAVKKSFD